MPDVSLKISPLVPHYARLDRGGVHWHVIKVGECMHFAFSSTLLGCFWFTTTTLVPLPQCFVERLPIFHTISFYKRGNFIEFVDTFVWPTPSPTFASILGCLRKMQLISGWKYAHFRFTDVCVDVPACSLHRSPSKYSISSRMVVVNVRCLLWIIAWYMPRIEYCRNSLPSCNRVLLRQTIGQ